MKQSKLLVLTVCLWGDPLLAGDSYAEHRLFMTPEQRQHLELRWQIKSQDAHEPQTQREPVSPSQTLHQPQTPDNKIRTHSLQLNGLIIRPDNNTAVVWVNQEMRSPKPWNDIGGERVALTKDGARLTLSPGQTAEVDVHD